MTTTNPQQVGALLKAVIGKGVDTKDAVPTIKALIEAKIFVLTDLTPDSMPTSIDPTIQQKILPAKFKTKKKRASKDDDDDEYPNKRFQSSSVKRKKKAPAVEVPLTIPPPCPINSSDQTMKPRPEFILVNRSPVFTLWASIVAMHLYPSLSLPEALTLGSAVAATHAKAKGTSLGIFQPNDENNDDDKKDSNTYKNDDDADNNNDDDDDHEMDRKNHQHNTKNQTIDKKKKKISVLFFDLLGSTVRAQQTSHGIRAEILPAGGGGGGGELGQPEKIWKLLQRKFPESSLTWIMNDMNVAAAQLVAASCSTGTLGIKSQDDYGGDDQEINTTADNQHHHYNIHDVAYEYYKYIRPDIPCGTKGWGAHGRLYLARLTNFLERLPPKSMSSMSSSLP